MNDMVELTANLVWKEQLVEIFQRRRDDPNLACLILRMRCFTESGGILKGKVDVLEKWTEQLALAPEDYGLNRFYTFLERTIRCPTECAIMATFQGKAFCDVTLLGRLRLCNESDSPELQIVESAIFFEPCVDHDFST